MTGVQTCALPICGGRGGPDLSKVGNRRDAEYIAAHIRDPQAHNPRSRMPKTDEGKLSPDDLQVLADYLAGMK